MGPEERKFLHRLECCDDEVCAKSTLPMSWSQKARALKAAKNNKKEEEVKPKRVLPHLNPLLTEFREGKRSLADILGDEDKNVASKKAKMEKKSKENEEEFYASFVPKSDDMWEALEEEVDAIEKFFLSKKNK